MSDTLEAQVRRIVDECYGGNEAKSFRHAFHRDCTPKIVEAARAREQAARLEEAEWWEHLVPSDHDDGGKTECLYCQRLAALRASREPKEQATPKSSVNPQKEQKNAGGNQQES